MKPFLSQLAFWFALIAGHLGAATVDELETFLDIHSWSPLVSVRSGTASVEIFSITNGNIGRRIIELPLVESQVGLSVLIGPQNGEYKVMLRGNTYAVSAMSSIPEFVRPTFYPKLPARLSAGDYVLFGHPKADIVADTKALEESEVKSIGFYANGFLLRVKIAE